MPPRFLTNPAPKTESAREARKSFFCELCQKGYSRMNEFEAHESSYDHQHKRRLKEMKQMQRDANASDRARRAERKADEKAGVISIKPVKLENKSAAAAAAGNGFKKGGFKSAFSTGGGKAEEEVGVVNAAGGLGGVFGDDEDEEMMEGEKVEVGGISEESEEEDFGYEYYDPRKPTGCDGSCYGKH